MPPQPEYPWFAVVTGDVLEQGDLLRGCPRFLMPPGAYLEGEVTFERGQVDAVVLTQSCDLAVRLDGACEAVEILLCPFVLKKDLSDHPLFRRDEVWEDVRKGRRPYFHVLNECVIEGHEQDFALLDFHSLFTLPVALVHGFAEKAGERLRLLPPYREHLAQAFARLFMRVGLPADVPPFGKRK